MKKTKEKQNKITLLDSLEKEFYSLLNKIKDGV